MADQWDTAEWPIERLIADIRDQIDEHENALAERRQSRDHLIRTALAEGKSPGR